MVCEGHGFAAATIALLWAMRRMLSEPDPETPTKRKARTAAGNPHFGSETSLGLIRSQCIYWAQTGDPLHPIAVIGS
jgi:hypothetical protein